MAWIAAMAPRDFPSFLPIRCALVISGLQDRIPSLVIAGVPQAERHRILAGNAMRIQGLRE